MTLHIEQDIASLKKSFKKLTFQNKAPPQHEQRAQKASTSSTLSEGEVEFRTIRVFCRLANAARASLALLKLRVYIKGGSSTEAAEEVESIGKLLTFRLLGMRLPGVLISPAE